MKKIAVLYLLEVHKFEKIKWSYYYFCQFTYLAKMTCQENPCSLKLALSFLKEVFYRSLQFKHSKMGQNERFRDF